MWPTCLCIFIIIGIVFFYNTLVITWIDKSILWYTYASIWHTSKRSCNLQESLVFFVFCSYFDIIGTLSMPMNACRWTNAKIRGSQNELVLFWSSHLFANLLTKPWKKGLYQTWIINNKIFKLFDYLFFCIIVLKWIFKY